MIRIEHARRAATAALLAALSLALAACMLTPGRFTSSLDLRKDGHFAFTYTGEIRLLALSKLAEMGRNASGDETFTPQPCYPADGGEARECTRAEIDKQKREWSEQRARGAEKRARDNELMKAMFGGIDPADPKAAEELAARLRKQVGWRKVLYKGDGLYEVDFAIAGSTSHDFSFPNIERFPMANPFVQVIVRNDGTVRVDAPAFGPGAAGEPYRSMMQAAAMSDGKPDAFKLPAMDGTFTITTDGAVLANNTDEGPQADPAGQRLSWTVNARSTAAPTALVRLAR